jgi:SnoaL-like polyketide cyclase
MTQLPRRPRARPTWPKLLDGSSRRLQPRKVELADQLISPQAINHDPAEPAKLRALRGPEVFKRTVMMYRAAFPDVQITVDDVIAADDKVVLRWHSEGTHRGELEGLAPTGARSVGRYRLAARLTGEDAWFQWW